jgi:crotonobetaine/carnitine-CoA ligase
LLDRISTACALSLAKFKWPAEIRLVDHLPRSTLNKVSKAELRAILRDET